MITTKKNLRQFIIFSSLNNSQYSNDFMRSANLKFLFSVFLDIVINTYIKANSSLFRKSSLFIDSISF